MHLHCCVLPVKMLYLFIYLTLLQVVKIAKMFKLLRIIKMLRLLKIGYIIQKMESLVSRNIVRVFMLMACSILITHIVGCAFYYTAYLQDLRVGCFVWACVQCTLDKPYTCASACHVNSMQGSSVRYKL